MWVMGGGRTAPNPSNQVDVFTPGTPGSWGTGPSFVTARRNFPSDSGGGRVYVVGGYAPTTATNSMEIYTLPVQCGTPGPSTNTPTRTPTQPIVNTPTRTNTPPPVPPTNTPTSTPCPLQFTDVPPNHTFYPFIRCLACRGIVSGYSDPARCPTGVPCFHPEENVTRGQIAKIVSNSAGFSDPAGAQMFEDVPPGHTFYLFIQRLATRGIISGYPCGGVGEPCIPPDNRPYFRPGNWSTRGQLSKIVCLAYPCSGVPSTQTFEDVPVGHTFYVYIEQLFALGAINGYPCGVPPAGPCIPPENRPYFLPGANVTRGQTAKIDANVFFPNCDTPARPSNPVDR
jgi:hypothetical protein